MEEQPYLRKPKNGQPEQNWGERVVLDLTEGLRGQNITADIFFQLSIWLKSFYKEK